MSSPASESAHPPVKLRPGVLAVPAYRQGKAPTKPGFKLSSNENPYPPLPGVLDALAARTDVNRYAGAAMPELRGAIAEDYGVTPDRVHLGAGSVAILYQLVQAAAGPGEEYVHAWPSFEAYPALGVASEAVGVGVPLGPGARHDLDAMAAAITDRTRVVIVCTPNNPTGPAVRQDEFEAFLPKVPADCLVILDEAYEEFVTDDAAVRGASLLAAHPNLVVLRTFSKAYGLAGLRMGFGLGDPAIFAAASSVAIPLSVTGLAETAALASMTPEARTEHARRIEAIVRDRAALIAGLRDLGFDVPDSQSNFVWVPQRPGGLAEGGVESAADFGEAVAEEGTLVRPFPGHGVRITVGEHESVAELLRIARAFVAR